METIFIWSILGWGGNALLLAVFGEQCFPRLKRMQFWLAVVLINAMITTVLYATLPMSRFLSVALVTAMVLEIVPYLLITKGHIGKRIFFALNTTYVAALIGMVTMNLCIPMSISANIVKLVLCILVALLYLRFICTPLETAIYHLGHHWLWLNFTGLIFSAVFYWAILSYMHGTMPRTYLVLAMLLTAVVYVGLFYTLFYMSESITLSQNKLQEETLLGQVERLVDIEEQARIMRHDLRHHNEIIASFMKRGQSGAVLEYLADYDKSLLAECHPSYCTHPLANNILGVYHTKMEKAGICFLPQVSMGADCPVGQRDLLGLLSNILENALQGCDIGGEVKLRLFQQDGKLVILCENTALSPVQFEKGIPQNTLRKSSGMASILRTAERYGGLTDFSQREGIFTAHIILHL